MTIAERNVMLQHYITCLKCGVSGKPCDADCPTQYDAGNMGEIIENLEAISKALEQDPVIDKIKENIQFIKDKCLPNNIAEEYEQKGLQEALDIIDKYKAER